MKDFKIYLSAPPELASEAINYGPVSIMACEVTRGLKLTRLGPLPALRGERLVEIACHGLTGFGPQEALVENILRFCLIYGFSGVVLDLPRPTPALLSLSELMADRLAPRGLTLYLPEGYGGVPGKRGLLINAQSYSSPFSDRLRLLAGKYGPEKIALRLDTRPADFLLPARRSLPSRLPSPVPGGVAPDRVFYSQCFEANYTSFRDRDRVRLVMWDDANSVRRKLEIAGNIGIHTAFLDFAENRAIIRSLI